MGFISACSSMLPEGSEVVMSDMRLTGSAQFESAIKGHVLETAKLIGICSR